MSNNAKVISSNRWTTVLINAIITLTIGIVLIFVPNTVYSMIIIGIGAVLILSGFSFFIYNHFSKNLTKRSKTLFLTQSIINIVVGLFLVFQSEIVYNFTVYFIAIWLIITGGSQIFSAPTQKNIIPNTNIILINGILALSLGVIILIWPRFPFIFIGYLNILISIILLYYSFISFKHRNQNITVEFENTTDIEAEEIIDNKIK